MILNRLLVIAALVIWPGASLSQEPTAPFEITLAKDYDTGELVASSVNASEQDLHRGYYRASSHIIRFWIEARRSEAGDIRVLITGQKLIWRGLRETRDRGEFGPWDPKDPVFVGRRLDRTDVLARWTKIDCNEAEKYCSRVDALDIPLSPEKVRDYIAASAPDDIKIALTRRNRVDFRIPKAELIATLEALDALEHFQ